MGATSLIADISGYTKFVRKKKVSAIHGEQIITELLESVTKTAEFPLKLNKIEGDAVFLYAEAGSDTQAAVNNVFKQAQKLMVAFSQRQAELDENADGGCPCGSCTMISSLGLKIVIHADEIIVKSIAGRQELAGEGVILIHRLLKNSISSMDYILLTVSASTWLDRDLLSGHEILTEQVADFGAVGVAFLNFNVKLKVERNYRPLSRLTGIKQALRLFYKYFFQRNRATG